MRGFLLGSVLSWVGVSFLGAIGAACGASADGVGSPDPSGGSGGAIGAGGSMRGSGGAAGVEAGGTSGTGGVLGTGGAGGGIAGDAGPADSGQSPPHIVGKCDALSAVGTWDEVTPKTVSLDTTKGFNTGVNAFVIDPSNSAVLYLGTCAQGIYKSTDCGATWTKINTGTLGKDIDGGRNWTMVVDPMDPQVVYSNAGYGPPGLFKSTNGGVDWVQLFGEGTDWATYVDYAFVEFLAMDPTDHQHLVVSSHATCHGPADGPTCFAESTDAGATWRMIKADPTMGYEGVAHALISRTTWLTFAGMGIYLTQDSGATWTKAFDIGGLNTNGEVYRGDDGNYYSPSFYGVVKSPDAIHWTMIPNSPHGNSLTGDGTTVFVSARQSDPPYFSATGDLTKWAEYPAPTLKNGSWLMRYDRDHNLLYTSNESGGFWRVRTE